MLSEFELTRWNGGQVHQISDRIFHMMRGELYSIYGKNFLHSAGARSVDKHRREESVSWWKEEEPSVEEMEYAAAQLEKHLADIDYVITHETPLFARDFIKRTKEIDEDYTLPAFLDDWYEQIKEKVLQMVFRPYARGSDDHTAAEGFAQRDPADRRRRPVHPLDLIRIKEDTAFLQRSRGLCLFPLAFAAVKDHGEAAKCIS